MRQEIRGLSGCSSHSHNLSYIPTCHNRIVRSHLIVGHVTGSIGLQHNDPCLSYPQLQPEQQIAHAMKIRPTHG